MKNQVTLTSQQDQPKTPKAFSVTPGFIAGLIASDGNFSILATKTWYRPYVTIVLNKVDSGLIYLVQQFFTSYFKDKSKNKIFGKPIRERPRKNNDGPMTEWEVQTIRESILLACFFKQYPLYNNRQLSFNLWVECVALLSEIQNIRDAKRRAQCYVDIMYYRQKLNPYGNPLTYTLEDAKQLYPNANFTEPQKISIIEKDFKDFQQSVLPTFDLPKDFVSGYVTGDGGSYCAWKKAKGNKKPRFIWNMNIVSIDLHIIQALQRFFNTGKIYPYKNDAQGNTYYRLMITDRRKFIEIYETTFCEYPLYGKKADQMYWLYRCCYALEHREDPKGPISDELRAEIDYYLNERNKIVYLK